MNLLVTAACPKSLSVPAPPERLFLRRRGRYLRLSLGSGEQTGRQGLRGCLPPRVLFVVGGGLQWGRGREWGWGRKATPGTFERVCLAVCAGDQQFLHLPWSSIHPFICPSIHPTICPYIHASIILMCIHPPALESKHHPLIRLPGPHTHLSVCPSICLSIHAHPHPFICPSILPYIPVFPSIYASMLSCV